MIQLPKEIKLMYDNDIVMFNSLIEDLKRKSIAAKNRLLSEKFEPYPNNGTMDDKCIFFMQFDDLILDLIFPDDEVLNKLRELKFAKHTLRWFVKIDDILKEIERLKNIKEMFFFPYQYLFVITSHLKVKLLISLVEDFELNTNYNNADTNIIFKDFAERFRRREYNEKKKQTQKMDFFEKLMNSLYDSIVKLCNNDKVHAKKMMLKQLKGDTSQYYTQLNSFHCEGISKNKVYKELFPLLKMIMKDDELLSEEEFGNKKDAYYEANYSKYKIARTKKILQKK